MFSRRFVANGGAGGAEDGEWEGGVSSSGAAGQGEVAVFGEVLMPLLSPALIGTLPHYTSMYTYSGLLFFRAILRMHDGSTDLLTNPTKVFHRLYHHYAAARAE